MNSFSRFVMLVMLLCLLAAVSIAEGQSDQLPGEIAGYRVWFTYNSEDVACMRPNVTQILLQAPQTTVEAFLAEVNFAAVLETIRQIPSTREIRVGFVGPNTRAAGSLGGFQRWNEVHRNRPCEPLTPLETGSNGDEFALPSGSYGFVIFENIDAGSYTNDNAQSVILQGPTTIGNPPAGVALLNNVKTNTGYLLQNGFIFTGGTGFISWTSTTQELEPNIYPIEVLDYYGTHYYWFGITYTDEVWWLCAYDFIDQGYYCQPDDGTGTHLAADLNTSVFLENHNTSSSWYSGFSGTWSASQAAIYLDGFGQPWSSDHLHTAHSCSSSYPTSNAMSGSLAGGGTGTFTLSGVPLRC